MKGKFLKPNPARSGFTLIEVLLVVVLTAMIMYGMGEIFKMSSNVVGGSEAELEVRQRARMIFSRMEIDLSCLLIDANGNYFEIRQGQKNFDDMARLWYRLRLVTSAKYNPEGIPGRSDVTRISYRLYDRSKATELYESKGMKGLEPEAPLLVRTSLTNVTNDMRDLVIDRYPDAEVRVFNDPAFDPNPEDFTQYRDIIAGNVYDFLVEFFSRDKLGDMDDLDLVSLDTYWKTYSLKTARWRKSLPRAVRVSVSVGDSRKRIERTFETTIPIKASYLQAPQGGNP